MSEFYTTQVIDVDTVMSRVEALPPRAAAWVDRQLETQGDDVYFDDASINGLVDEAEGLDSDALEDSDLPSLSMAESERLTLIRERIAARIPDYQGESGGRQQQIMLGENVPSADQGWYTEYQDRADIADRASSADAEGRVLDENGDPMDGRWGWVMDEETGYLLFFPESEVTLKYPDGTISAPMTRAEGIPLWREARARGEDVVVVKVHHTTPVAGMPVTGAGLMTLQDGWILDITDESGHYQPTASNQYEAMEAMSEQGLSFQRPVSAQDSPDGEAGYRDARVHLTGAGGGTGSRPTGKAGWLNEMHAENPDVPADELTLTAQQFEQTEGNEVQARLKAGLNKEFTRTKAGDLRSQAGDEPEPEAPQTGDDSYGADSYGADSYGGAQPAPTGGYDQPTVYDQQPAPTGGYDQPTPYDEQPAPTAAEAATAVPANSLGEGYAYDAQRQLFQQQDTGHYFSAEGQLVYQWDPEQGRYFDHTTQTWM